MSKLRSRLARPFQRSTRSQAASRSGDDASTQGPSSLTDSVPPIPSQGTASSSRDITSGALSPTSSSIPGNDGSGVRDKAESDVHSLTDLWDAAFIHYKDTTGIDIRDQDSDLYRCLQGCTDTHAVVSVLAKTADDFGLFRHPPSHNIRAKIRRVLSSIVRTVLDIGALEVGGEVAAASSVPGGKALFVAIGMLLRASQGVSDNFDGVVRLLEQYEFYMRRLDVRINVPFASASHMIVVKILVEMLHTFAIVTEMMRKRRIRHFVSVLAGGENTITAATRRLEALQIQENCLNITATYREATNIYREVCALSCLAQDALPRLENYVAQLNGNMENMSSQVAGMTVEMRTTADAVSHVEFMITRMSRMSNTRNDTDGARSGSTHVALSRPQNCETGIVELWCNCLTVTYLRAVSNLDSLAHNMLSCYNDLSPADRAVLRNNFALMYSAAAFTAGGSGSAWCAALVNPTVFLSAFLPMAIAYVAAFLCWKYIPRALRESDTVLIIDVLGAQMWLPLGSSWEEVHAHLLTRFADQNWVEYVSSRAYTIIDTARESEIITPTSWARTVRGGMVLEMSIVVRQPSRSLQCPYCDRSSMSQATGDEILYCKSCRRQYRATSAILTTTESDGISDDSSLPESYVSPIPSYPPYLPPSEYSESPNHTDSTSHDEPLSCGDEENARADISAQETRPRRTIDMKVFRRIMVELLKSTQEIEVEEVFVDSTTDLFEGSYRDCGRWCWAYLGDDLPFWVWAPYVLLHYTSLSQIGPQTFRFVRPQRVASFHVGTFKVTFSTSEAARGATHGAWYIVRACDARNVWHWVHARVPSIPPGPPPGPYLAGDWALQPPPPL